MAVKRALAWGIAWYVSVGVVVGIVETAHQMSRLDPGFDPLFTGFVTIFTWPVLLVWKIQAIVAHLDAVRT